MQAQDIIDFWFGLPERTWFIKDAGFDAQLRERFGQAVGDAQGGRLVHWAASAHGELALILLCDQFTRNIHRNSAQAFAGDALALSTAQALVKSGRHLALAPIQRVFAYLPFEHAESMALQDEAVALFGQLAADHPELAGYADYAERHRTVIQRFGRFPHRNEALGRNSSAAELAYLADEGGF
jgi:uncharacterized protein (DUF924 family)